MGEWRARAGFGQYLLLELRLGVVCFEWIPLYSGFWNCLGNRFFGVKRNHSEMVLLGLVGVCVMAKEVHELTEQLFSYQQSTNKVCVIVLRRVLSCASHALVAYYSAVFKANIFINVSSHNYYFYQWPICLSNKKNLWAT